MKMTAALRLIAIAIAVAGMLDPAISARQRQPLAVEFATGPGSRASDVRERLLTELGAGISVTREGHGDAVVVIDGRVKEAMIRDGVPVSLVAVTPPPNVRLVAASVSGPILPGQQSAVDVDADVRGLTGRTSVMTVIQNGVEIGRVERTWTDAARQRLAVPFVVLGAGTYPIRVAAAPLPEESTQDDNALDVTVTGVARTLRVAVIEMRPAWSASFVRRALETDPVFHVASSVRASRGIEIRAGESPASLRSASLEDFDVVIVGAPEELRMADFDVLHRFMADRGGTAVILPDRRPSGLVASFIAPGGFDEVLLDTPVILSTGGEGVVRASEFAVVRPPAPALRTLASLPDGRSVIASLPVGNGSLLYSGALDAWRFRAADADRFASFWRASIAAAALAAPPKLQVEVEPGFVPPGIATRIVVRVRQTEFERAGDGSIRIPAVSAAAADRRADALASEFVRLWPTAEPGVFRGAFTPPGEGQYVVHASIGTAQDTALLMASKDARLAQGDDREAAMLAAGTGGVATTDDRLAPLVTQLRSLPRRETSSTLHPMRSGWWILPFALALCAEWTLRRRTGHR